VRVRMPFGVDLRCRGEVGGSGRRAEAGRSTSERDH